MDFTSQTYLTVDDQMVAALNETSKWAKFIAILGFVGIGIMVIASLVMGLFMADTNAFISGYVIILYLGIALLYFFPVLYLYRFASRSKSAVLHGSSEALTDAMVNLKSHYKFMGILCVIMLVIYVLAFIGGILGGALMNM